MKRLLTSIAAFLLSSAVLTGTAAAQNPHYLIGPSCSAGALTVTCTGSIAGLGNENIDVQVTATGIGSVTCTNPAGNVAPGQATTVNASGTVTGIEVDNGRATFSVTTLEPADPDPAVVCPNRKWTADITSVDFSSATISVFQPSESGILVLGPTTFTF